MLMVSGVGVGGGMWGHLDAQQSERTCRRLPSTVSNSRVPFIGGRANGGVREYD